MLLLSPFNGLITVRGMQITELLARVPLFHELEPTDLEKIASVTRCENYTPNQDIVHIGDPGHSLYVVVDGYVTVLYPSRSSDVELARLGTGEFFGEMAILNAKPRSATVRALGEVRVLVLERDDFTRALEDSPQITLKLLSALSVRIRNTDEQLSGLTERALRDDLTGLLNRRAFHDRLSEESDRGRRYGDAFALLLLDIDHFKRVNDSFGHDIGDVVLGWVGRLLAEHTRGADIPFRVGGEEFAVLCPEIGVTEAALAAQRLVEVVAEARAPRLPSLSASPCPQASPSALSTASVETRSFMPPTRRCSRRRRTAGTG